jgi:hypothetical protein
MCVSRVGYLKGNETMPCSGAIEPIKRRHLAGMSCVVMSIVPVDEVDRQPVMLHGSQMFLTVVPVRKIEAEPLPEHVFFIQLVLKVFAVFYSIKMST